jgi:hypothetical protein
MKHICTFFNIGSKFGLHVGGQNKKQAREHSRPNEGNTWTQEILCQIDLNKHKKYGYMT